MCSPLCNKRLYEYSFQNNHSVLPSIALTLNRVQFQGRQRCKKNLHAIGHPSFAVSASEHIGWLDLHPMGIERPGMEQAWSEHKLFLHFMPSLENISKNMRNEVPAPLSFPRQKSILTYRETLFSWKFKFTHRIAKSLFSVSRRSSPFFTVLLICWYFLCVVAWS